MKKLLPFLLLLSLAITSCNNNDSDPQPEEEAITKPEEEVDNWPKQLQLSKISSTNKSPGEKNYISTLTYKSGLLSTYVEDHADGVNGFRSYHQYGADRRLTSFTLYKKSADVIGELLEKHDFSYDSFGKLDTVIVTPGDRSPQRFCTFTYNSEGQVEVIKESAKNSPGTALLLKFDAAGNVVEMTSYKTQVSGELEKDPVYITRITYDDKKNPFKGMGSILYGYNHPFRYSFPNTRSNPVRLLSTNNPLHAEIITNRSFLWASSNFLYNENGFPSEIKSDFMVQKLEYSMQ